MSAYVPKTYDELRALALQVVRGELFVSWQIRDPDLHLLPQIFMALFFLTDEMRQELVRDKIQFFYAEYKDAMPRALNGYPTFTGCGTLNRADGLELGRRVRAAQQAMEAAA